ncbi:MAG TPA: dienelactone hydrolase family protein [Planctomycetota bacterium]|nr:dienelactone hydrolase family protein [Planctomycetota bacterium]
MPHVPLQPPPLPPTLYDDIIHLPAGDGGGRITTPAEWAIKRADIRRRFLGILGEPPARRPAPVARIIDEVQDDDLTRRRIAYAVEDDEDCEAFLLLPRAPRGDGAAVLCLSATFVNGKDVLAGLAELPEHWLARDLARRGFIVLAPDHFCAGARAPQDRRFADDALYRRHPRWSALGKALWDGTAAIDVLAAAPGVDPRRIGCTGASLGGHGSIFLAAYDERIAAAVAMVGSTAWRADSERMHWCRDWWYRYAPALREGFLAGRVGTPEGVPVDMMEIAALIAPRPFLDIAALNDENVGAESGVYVKDAWLRVSDAYAILGAESAFAFVTHRHGHRLPEWTRACSFAFLAQHLGAAR